VRRWSGSGGRGGERERERETEKVGGEGMSVERVAVEKSGELFVPAVAVEVRPFTGF
jgi:hypothetical protein